ncbi:hypothetical protein LCGC14_0294420 [marine sediment metagenome]|uniref:SF4 helicase domain-containing protein n=1 Tax=marine sediment metagenome TaxID=412755 RepID=A0A0F9TWY2_9ZZZZ
MSLVLVDSAFLEKWRHTLVPESLPKGPTRFLLGAALEHWDAHHQLMDWAAFLYWVDGAIEDEDLHEEYRQIFLDIQAAYPVTDSSRPIAWAAAEEWVQNYHVGMALDRARAALVAGDRGTAFSELLGVREVTGEVQEEPLELVPSATLGDILRHSNNFREAIPLGLELFDEALEGGIHPGDLAIVAGPTNLGKSMLLCYLAASAYKANRRVLYLTYELSRVQIGERILMALFEKPKQDLNPDTLADDLIAKRTQWGVTDRGSVVIEEGIRTVADLRRHLEEADVDLVLLDSADDITARQTYPNLYLSQGEVYSDILLDICHSMNLPVWTSVQLNREAVEKARISLKHIGDSFKKVQRATLCVGLSQAREEADFYLGPLVKLVVLKDSQHGAQGQWWRYLTSYGRGAKGWPAYNYYPERGDLE